MYVISIDHMSTQYLNSFFLGKISWNTVSSVIILNCHSMHLWGRIKLRGFTMKLLQLLTCLDLTSIPLRSAHHYLTLIIFLHLYKLTNKIHQHYCISQNSWLLLLYKSRVSQKQFSCTVLCKCSNGRTTILTK